MRKKTGKSDDMIWANLIHLSYNMWHDRISSECSIPHISAKPYLRFDESLWRDILEQMAVAGMNMVVIDLGDAVRYESRPEIAVKKAWSVKKLRRELNRARSLGVEPIPKLNFSTCHDAWLGPYSRCVSTDAYYAVCRDLIAEVISLFDKPRFFHLGMDEETARHQVHYAYAVMRQHELWWHDLYFLVDLVEKGGSQAWIWSDYMWDHHDEFLKKMPKSVLQSNWYYMTSFRKQVKEIGAFLDLDRKGYDQVPTGSNWCNDENFGKLVTYSKQRLSSRRLKGFMHTTWRPTLEEFRAAHMGVIKQAARCISRMRSGRQAGISGLEGRPLSATPSCRGGVS